MKRNKKSIYWLAFIGIAVLIHVLVFVFLKPGFFSVFVRSPSDTDRARGGAVLPDAIITIPIDITEISEATVRLPDEGTADDPMDTPQDVTTEPSPPGGDAAGGVPEIESLIGESPITLPQTPGSETVAIPPRPIQITWPDTRELKHCLGHYINVRILVGVGGEILDVEAARQDHPTDCIEAALRSARRIVFEPGRIDGAPAEMWTQVRIDFKRGR